MVEAVTGLCGCVELIERFTESAWVLLYVSYTAIQKMDTCRCHLAQQTLREP